jgi:tRNA G18 (ribose-2'-O)-methylase SpoU
LKIPLKGKTSSLNASVAAAISLFHLTNQWGFFLIINELSSL